MAVQSMITSKDIISKTGISRATLNNYIKLGILPKPVVGPPRPGDRSVKQIGYFPEEVIARLEKVKLLKEKGNTMNEISRLFQAEYKQGEQAADIPDPLESESSTLERRRPYTRITDKELKVTICDLKTPAYLVNQNFEIEWINKQAEDIVFNKKVRSLVDSKSRNIFRLFLEKRELSQADEWIDLASLHLTVLQKRINGSSLSGLFTGITSRDMNLLKDIYNSRVITVPQQIYRIPVSVTLPGNIRHNYLVYTMNFREGTFFVFLPDEGVGSDLMSLLSQRQRVINDLLKHRMPSLVSLCVLVADLQDSMRISAELLPGEYFELINGLWECTGPVFEKYKGVYGKHVGDGVLYYFLNKPGTNYMNNCINCSIDLREAVLKFSDKWKGLKGWDNELFLNTGINEGQEFFGTIRSADNIEFTALGDTINTAARLSEFARNGQIWTTKNLVSKLSQEERNILRFGVHKNNDHSNRFVRDSFSRVTDLLTTENINYRHLSTIAGLPITEIKERIKPA